MSVRRSFSVLLIAVVLLGAGCSSDDADAESGSASNASSSTTPPVERSTTTAAEADLTEVVGLRTKRYCEVLLLTIVDGDASAEVFNTYPLNECSEDQWKALDAAALTKEHDVDLARLNGPRYWLMDRIDKAGGRDDLPIETFGELDMYRQASVHIGPLAQAGKPYTPSQVDRRTVFTFDEGRTVYELTDPDGNAYVMQSWSQQVDPTLDEAGLAELGPRLKLPAGWAYRTRTLDAPLRVVTTDSPATVLQDDFQNSYSKETTD